MSRWIALASLSATLAFPPALHAQAANDVPAAQAAANQWLTVTDAGQAVQSWEQASSLFRNTLTASAWGDALQKARDPLGAVKSRELKSATYTRTLPGAPQGEYVVIQYESRFERVSTSMIETITPMREADGSWKVSGYFIRPAR